MAKNTNETNQTINGKNVTIKVQGSTMTIVVDLTQDLGPSKSGKTNIVGTTNGFVGLADGVGVSLNVVKRAA